MFICSIVVIWHKPCEDVLSCPLRLAHTSGVVLLFLSRKHGTCYLFVPNTMNGGCSVECRTIAEMSLFIIIYTDIKEIKVVSCECCMINPSNAQ